MFTERPSNEEENERLRTSLIVEYLQRFPVALEKYLEFLIYEKKLEASGPLSYLCLVFFYKLLGIN